MLMHRQSWIRRASLVLLVMASLFLPSPAAAQDEQDSPFLVTLAKQIILDPTTYAPAAIAYDSRMRDWNTSQVFYQNGYLERNARFTASGLPFDTPLSYGEGRNGILRDAFVHLQISAVHNATTRSLEQMLIERFPERRTLIRVLGWIERSAFASYLSYQLSYRHYEQARLNQQLAVEYGFR